MGYAEVRAAEMNLEKVRAECKARLEQAEAASETFTQLIRYWWGGGHAQSQSWPRHTR